MHTYVGTFILSLIHTYMHDALIHSYIRSHYTHAYRHACLQINSYILCTYMSNVWGYIYIYIYIYRDML